jgi:DNA-binding NarL/FixJ family response regulator
MDNMQTPPVLALVRDLIFATKITSTARALNVPVQVLRDPAQLNRQPGRLLIVDLNLPGATPAAAAWKTVTSQPVVGFASHTDAATIAAARDAGLDRVLPRSRFVEILPELLKAGAEI